MSDSLAIRNEALVDRLTQMIRSQRIGDAVSVIDAYEDPAAVGLALNSVVKKLYREYKDVTNMIVAGNMGLGYCLRKSALESNQYKIRELKRLSEALEHLRALGSKDAVFFADQLVTADRVLLQV